MDALLSILNLSTEATAIYEGPELKIVFANEGMRAMFGKSEGIIGQPLLKVLPEIAGQAFPELLKQVWESGETYTANDMLAKLEVGGELKDYYFDFTYRLVKDDQGKAQSILHTARDVTSRVIAWQRVESANARLTESESNFRRLVEQAPVAILVFRGKNMVIDIVNEAMLEILRKDRSIIGKPLLEGLPEIEGAQAVDQLFEVYRSGNPSDGNEAPVPMPRNGKVETRYFNFSYRPLLEGGKVIGVMDVAVDVTEQVLARQKIEANQKRLQDILDTMAEGVVIVDAEARPTYANPMAQRIMGIDEKAFKARSYNDANWHNERLDGTPLPKEDHPMYVVLRTGQPVYDQEIAIVLPDDHKFYISINAAPLMDENDVSGGILTFTDVTNRRLLLQQKEDFISVASHELKTPVTSLKASLQLMERVQHTITPEMLIKLITQANKSLNKLNDLVNSLLNSNRISEGRFPTHKTSFSISELINDCCHHIRSAGKHDIRLEGDPQLKVKADEQLTDQVIVNLVNNAVKYAPKSREIVIRIEKASAAVKISVIDFGPGIPPEKTEHIFKRYYQAEKASREFNGLGLGLYICAEIIEKHGGVMGVDSEVGKGSTFWFTLPDNDHSKM